MSNAIVTENQNTGSSGWDFRSQPATTQIQAYADKLSLDPGQTINFFVSTQSGGTTYTVNIYRLGWYGGTGGCLKSTSSGRTGVAQGYWNDSNTTLNNCPTAIVDNTTKLLEAGWTSTDSWSVPTSACTGIYVAMFTDANGYSTVTTFVVRGNTNAAYVVVQPDTTDCAYNKWGSNSLYSNVGVAVKASFNRPISRTPVDGIGGPLGTYAFEIPAIHWLERMGYDLSYISDIDLHATANILQTHQAYISLGHDEYWTYEMRAAVEAALASGIGLAFFGANACYWQCRLEADASSNANRTVTCYKVQSSLANLANDPQYGVNNAKVTTQWRDALLQRPENQLIGIMFYDNTSAGNQPFTIDANANSPFLTGTGLVNGSSYGSDLTGYEWDNNVLSPPCPNNLNVIGTSSITGVSHPPGYGNTTTYVASSGALVFASGSLAWTWGLDTFRWDGTAPAVVPGMQSLLAHIMTALIHPKNQTSFNSFAIHR